MIFTFPVSAIPPTALLAARTATSATDSGPGWEVVAAAAIIGLAAGVALGFIAARLLASRTGRDAPGSPPRRPRSWQKDSTDPATAESSTEPPRRSRAWESAGLADVPAQPADPDVDPPASDSAAADPPGSRRRSGI